MGRGHATRCSAGGGEDIPAPRETRAALTVGAAAVLAAGGTLAVTVVSAETDTARTAAAIVGTGGTVALMIVLLLGQPQLVAIPAALLGGAYAASLSIASEGIDLAAPLVAAGLLLACELAFWTHELRTGVRDEPGLAGLHGAWLSALSLGTLVVGVGVITLVDVAHVDGLVVEAVGTAAALGVAILLLLSARQRTTP